jgi:hypothetical protein
MSNVNSDTSVVKHDSTPLSITSLIKDFVVPTALVTGVGTYIGWNMGAGYYAAFRVPIGFTATPTPASLIPASPELLLGAFVFFSGFGVNRYVDARFREAKPNTIQGGDLIWFGILSVAISATLGLCIFSILLNFVNFTFSPINLVMLYSLIFTPFLLLLWSLSVVNDRLNENTDIIKPNRRQKTTLKTIFPRINLYKIVLAVSIFVMINRVGYWRGYGLGIRDINNPSRLTSIVIHSNEIYPIKHKFDANSRLYTYSNLKFVDSSKDFIIILDNNQKNQNTLILARKDSIVLEFER